MGILQTNKAQPKLSIVVPAHNILKNYSNLFTWVLDAVRLKVAVIIVHDKSTDSTGQLLSEFLEIQNNPLLTLIEIDAQSPGLARNSGLENATTEWVMFADADDFVVVDHVLQLIHIAENNQSDVGIGGYKAINVSSRRASVFAPSAGDLSIHLVATMGCWRFVFKREIIGNTRFASYRMAEDFLFVYELLRKTQKISASDLIVYEYYFGGESNLTSNPGNMPDMLKVIHRLKLLPPSNEMSHKYRDLAEIKLFISSLKNVGCFKSMKSAWHVVPKLFLSPLLLIRLIASILRKDTLQ